MSKSLARIIVPLLLCLIQSQPALSQQSEGKQKKQEGQVEIRKEIDALKEGQQQILKELQEIRKLLQARQESSVASVPTAQPPPTILNVYGESFKGDKGARVAIIEYSDFQCPFCAAYVRDTLPQINENYIKTGKVKYFFRDLPLPIHPNALEAARAARCASEQGKFWETHDWLFAHQTALTANDLPLHAQSVGLDVQKFNQCLASGRYGDNIRRSMVGAERIGIDGTPAFAIGVVGSNGDLVRIVKILFGAESYETFKTILDELFTSQAK